MDTADSRAARFSSLYSLRSQRQRGGALALTLLSLLAWLTWNQLRTVRHPWADLSQGSYTDHFSHMNAARAVTRVRLDLWRRSAKDLFASPSPDQLEAMPVDVRAGGSYTGGIYVVPGWPAAKPWNTSWSSKPRLYPPGDLLLVSPVALLYHFTDLSFTRANRLLIGLFLVFAHVAVYLAVRPACEVGSVATPVLWGGLLLFYAETIHWTVEGFYDASAVAPLLLCALFLHQKRGLAAGVAYCVAACIHFRAFFLAPWALYAAWLFLKGEGWRGLRGRDYAGALVGSACAVASLTAFALVVPTLGGQDISNAVNLSVRPHDLFSLAPFCILLALSGVLLVYVRAWLDLATGCWLSTMVFLVKEAYPWHILILMSWLPAPVSVVKGRGAELVRLVRLVVLFFVGTKVMRGQLWPDWVARFFS